MKKGLLQKCLQQALEHLKKKSVGATIGRPQILPRQNLFAARRKMVISLVNSEICDFQRTSNARPYILIMNQFKSKYMGTQSLTKVPLSPYMPPAKGTKPRRL